MLCLFLGEYTEEGLPKPLAQAPLSSFMNHRDYDGGSILVVPTTGLYIHTLLNILMFLTFHIHKATLLIHVVSL